MFIHDANNLSYNNCKLIKIPNTFLKTLLSTVHLKGKCREKSQEKRRRGGGGEKTEESEKKKQKGCKADEKDVISLVAFASICIWAETCSWEHLGDV